MSTCTRAFVVVVAVVISSYHSMDRLSVLEASGQSQPSWTVRSKLQSVKRSGLMLLHPSNITNPTFSQVLESYTVLHICAEAGSPKHNQPSNRPGPSCKRFPYSDDLASRVWLGFVA